MLCTSEKGVLQIREVDSIVWTFSFAGTVMSMVEAMTSTTQ